MAPTTDQPSAAIRPALARAQLDTDEPGSFDGPGQLGEGGQSGGTARRRESLSAVRDEQDNDRDDSRGHRDNDLREQPPAPSPGLETFAPVLEAWKQVFTSWSELTKTIVKAQQDAFASMVGAASSMTRR